MIFRYIIFFLLILFLDLCVAALPKSSGGNNREPNNDPKVEFILPSILLSLSLIFLEILFVKLDCILETIFKFLLFTL